MKQILQLAILASTLTCCTGTAQQRAQTAQKYTDAAGAVCEVVVQAADPALVPICTTATSVAKAIESLMAQKLAAQTTTKPADVTPPTNDEIYQWLASHGGQTVK